MCFGAIASAASSRSRDPEVRTTGSPTGTQTRGSSPRPKPKPSPISRAVSNVSRSFVNDLAMGLSTFGQSKEKQRETLRGQGYSESVIDDYQARTAASQERMREQMARSDDNDSSPAPAPAPTTPTPTPPPAPSADAEPAPGSAEAEVVAEAETRRGRRSTIQTGPQGLLTTARTRRRRSLMGGDEPRGLIT